MRFDELPVYRAIYKVRQQMVVNNEQPGAERWFIDKGARAEFCRRVHSELEPDEDLIIKAAIQFRKGSSISDGLKKLDLVCALSKTHGDRCFYENRGLGECSEDIHLDRLIPGSRGGAYCLENCVLACGYHNTSRGDMSIENFLLSGQVRLSEKRVAAMDEIDEHGVD